MTTEEIIKHQEDGRPVYLVSEMLTIKTIYFDRDNSLHSVVLEHARGQSLSLRPSSYIFDLLSPEPMMSVPIPNSDAGTFNFQTALTMWKSKATESRGVKIKSRVSGYVFEFANGDIYGYPGDSSYLMDGSDFEYDDEVFTFDEINGEWELVE